jgi:hypothetical protein
MRPRQSKAQQLLKFVDSLEPEVAPKIRAFIDSLEPEVATRLRPKRMRRATYAAGGLALLTAASAGISSLRDRLET